MTNKLATAAGAASVVAGMTLAIDKKQYLMPAFLGGWGAISYGLTDGFKKVDALTAAGIAGVVGGAMAARAPMDFGANPRWAKLGGPLFLAGWGALAVGTARQAGVPVVKTLLPAASIIGGAMLMRKNAFEGGTVPAIIPFVLFAGGWALFVAAALP